MNRGTFGVILLGVLGTIALAAPSGAQLKEVSKDAGTTLRSPFRRVEDDQARDAPQRARLLSPLKKPATSNAIPIDTWFHVIQKGPGTLEGNIPDSRIQSQLAALNSAYAAHGFQFVLKGTDRTTQPAWYPLGDGSSEENAMKQQLHKGTAATLNIYVVALKNGMLEWGTFPYQYSQIPHRDGVVVLNDALPGGSAAPYNLGKQAVHAVGHWLGLLHPFQGGCTGDGDLVGDTPQQQSAAYGCPVGRNTCPNKPGNDPISNFMNYTDDACMTEFTPGQAARMKDQWEEYRAGK